MTASPDVRTRPQFLAPVVTAFDESGELDLDGYRASIRRCLDGGLDGLLILGSAGEFFTLSSSERELLIQTALGEAGENARVLVGTGACSTHEAKAESARAEALGAKELMLISPYYFELDEDSLFEHFQLVAGSVSAAIHLYNFPARTSHDLSPELVQKLGEECPNIVGLKDTVVDVSHTRRVLSLVSGTNFEVFSGFDAHLVLNALMGGAGCIAALSNVFPTESAAWAAAIRKGEMEAIRHFQRAFDLGSRLYDVAPVFVPAIKHAMALQGVPITRRTRTGRDLTAGEARQVERIVAEVKHLLSEWTDPISLG